MIERLRITVLADDHVAAPNVLAEHGLSMLIEANDRRILFDTGQGKVLRGNADSLGIRLAGLDAVVVSHGHYDHTGGLAILLRECCPSAIFLHPAALQPKYAKSDTPHRSIGIPDCSRQALSAVTDRIVWTEAATEVVPGIWCTGEIPRVPANGPSETGFFLDGGCREPDPLADDQALFIETSNGIVVIAGCAHAGVANTLDRVSALTGRSEVCAVAGGLHLWRAAHPEMEASQTPWVGATPGFSRRATVPAWGHTRICVHAFTRLCRMWGLAHGWSSVNHEACRPPGAEAQAFRCFADVARNATIDTSRTGSTYVQ